MPARTPKACRQQGCRHATTLKHGYCEAHADKAASWSTGRAGRGRGGRPWRRTRDQVKEAAQGLCEYCRLNGFAVAGCVCDHIIPEAEGGTSDMSNLQWLCQQCSDTKTKQEAIRGRKCRHSA
ncbi:HNH endonuclease [Aliamphritea ceti]|uniref:HNH endonuclease n=1 Tax=Aliamphritea ceti TaxID=1524258 RepID=UPI0021C49831|nr:HNH endonuclease signature motif containing protein [Aliamphritea ceti]